MALPQSCFLFLSVFCCYTVFDFHDVHWLIKEINKDRSDRTCHVFRSHQVMSTPNRLLSLFISHSPTVGVHTQNCKVQSKGSKWQSSGGKCPYFWRYLYFSKTHCSTGRGKPVCKKSAFAINFISVYCVSTRTHSFAYIQLQWFDLLWIYCINIKKSNLCSFIRLRNFLDYVRYSQSR